MRYVALEDLKIGDILATPLRDTRGVILLSAGKPMTIAVIERLRQRGLSQVVIDDDMSKGIEPTTTVSGSLEKSIMESIMNLDVERVQQDASKMVDEMIGNGIRQADMLSVKTYDEYTYQHSFSVGMLSAIMGIAAGFARKDIEYLTCAGLMHDIGKLKIDPDIINAPRKLTKEEFDEIKKHPQMAYEMMKDDVTLSSTVRVAALQHHENEDGTGYPQGLKGDKIHRFSKIIHICDVFDALTSKRPYKDPMPRSEAIDYIMSHNTDMFSKRYSYYFRSIIPIYPTASTINLSDGKKLVVVQNDTKHMDNPIVRTEDKQYEGRLKVIMRQKEYKDNTLIGV